MRRLLSITTFALLALLLLNHSVQAANTAPISSLQVNANLQSDGTVTINQTIHYDQPNQLDWTLFTNSRHLTLEADGQPLQAKQYKTNGPTNQKHISSELFASDWQLNYNTTTTLIRQDNRDQVYFKIFQQANRTIANIKVNFSLPAAVPNNNLTGNVYSISGSINPQTTINSASTVLYTADFAGPQALFTISASWPKGVLELSPYQELRLSLLNQGSLPWLVLGLILPLITLLILTIMLWLERRGERKVQAVNSEAPSNLAPILVGVLVNKKIYPEEVVSLLVDLCQRGYAVIVKKGGEYYLSQRKVPDEHLQDWEREILDQLFPALGTKVSESGARKLGDNNLFSPKVRDAFNQIYQIITELGFFVENPHITRVRYKLVALFFYFLALAGMVWVALANVSAYLLIPLIGTLLIAYAIIRVSPRIIRYSKKGEALRENWEAFGNYLKLDEPLPLSAAQNHVFEKYLGYAISLHQTINWANRFDRSSTIMIKPDWFISYEDSGTKELASELVRFTEIVSKSLTKLRGPLVN